MSLRLPVFTFLKEMQELFKVWFPDVFFQPVSTGCHLKKKKKKAAQEQEGVAVFGLAGQRSQERARAEPFPQKGSFDLTTGYRGRIGKSPGSSPLPHPAAGCHPCAGLALLPAPPRAPPAQVRRSPAR